jgi:tetratricopeptide (TPR) repeat protein
MVRPLLLAAAFAAAPAPPASPPPPAGHEQALASLAAAREARARGDSALARTELARAVEADSGWDLPRLDLAELLLRESRDAAAALALLGDPGLRGENPRLPRLRGAALELQGDWAGAAAAYGEALRLRDEDELRLRRGLVLERGGASAEAIAELERYRAVRPADPRARSHLAELYEEAGRRSEAEVELRWLAAAAPTDPGPVRRLARFLERSGDPERAELADRAARDLERPTRVLRPLRPDGERPR